MDRIRAYLLSVIAAALICSVITALPGKNETLSAIRKTLCGIFMSVTLISPLIGMRIPDVQHYLNTIQADAAEAVMAGKMISEESTAKIIKEQTTAYILDKAAQMGVELEVSVTLTTELPQIPCGVTLSGMVSPYTRKRISQIIEDDLGISRGDQHWINTN